MHPVQNQEDDALFVAARDGRRVRQIVHASILNRQVVVLQGCKGQLSGRIWRLFCQVEKNGRC